MLNSLEMSQAEMSRADALQERMIQFAVLILKLTAALPTTVPGRHIARQLTRSGTSPAPNYGEARGAESRADFIHKLGIVLKELNETEIWLNIILQSRLCPPRLVEPALEECRQLARIITASVKTTKAGVRK
jgi:four helix bundle protein